MSSTEQNSRENSKLKEEKAQKRARKPSRFRKLSIRRASLGKDKRSNEEMQHLLTTEENDRQAEVEQEQIERKKVGVPTIDEIQLKEVPVYLICPKCGEKGITRTETQRSREAFCMSICLCLLQCYCCCWIPLVMNRLKEVTHTCPNCMEQIGIYKQYNFLSRLTKSEEKEEAS